MGYQAHCIVMEEISKASGAEVSQSDRDNDVYSIR